MPIIALSPVRASWQKTTCSCSARAEPSSRWGIANTLVTVATLLIPSRFLSEPDNDKRMPERARQALRGRRCPIGGPGRSREGAAGLGAFRLGPRAVPARSPGGLRPPSARAVRCVLYWQVTGSRDDLVTFGTVVATL